MEEREVFHLDLPSPLGMGHRARRDLRVWSATDLGMRLGDCTGGAEGQEECTVIPPVSLAELRRCQPARFPGWTAQVPLP